jgi:FKBP-type peptidyl-prolyl cis-trans isomerase SlyD
MQFESETDEGELEIVTIKSIDGNEVTIDANHPLAGVTLNFDVEVVGVREATAEEVEHEHVH